MRFTFCMSVGLQSLKHLTVLYMFSPGIRREPNAFNLVNIMQTNDPETIGNQARFILHGLKLYAGHRGLGLQCKQYVSTLPAKHNNCVLSCNIVELFIFCVIHVSKWLKLYDPLCTTASG